MSNSLVSKHSNTGIKGSEHRRDVCRMAKTKSLHVAFRFSKKSSIGENTFKVVVIISVIIKKSKMSEF